MEAAIVREGDGLGRVLEVIGRSRQRRVIVVDDRDRPTGIITDGDLLARTSGPEHRSVVDWLLGRGRGESVDLAAGELMTAPVVVIEARASALEALRRMVQARVKRLPVVDEEGRLVGVVDRQSLLRAVIGVSAG